MDVREGSQGTQVRPCLPLSRTFALLGPSWEYFTACLDPFSFSNDHSRRPNLRHADERAFDASDLFLATQARALRAWILPLEPEVRALKPEAHSRDRKEESPIRRAVAVRIPEAPRIERNAPRSAMTTPQRSRQMSSEMRITPRIAMLLPRAARRCP